MAQTFFQTAFALGLSAVWLGVILMLLPIFRIFGDPAYWRSLVQPYSERVRLQSELVSKVFQTIGQSRLNRLGQWIGAIGFTILILSGTSWLIVRILQNPSP